MMIYLIGIPDQVKNKSLVSFAPLWLVFSFYHRKPKPQRPIGHAPTSKNTLFDEPEFLHALNERIARHVLKRDLNRR